LCERSTWKNGMKRTSVSQRWIQSIRKIEADAVKHDILLKAVEMFLCLPGTSCPHRKFFLCNE
jgi:hypothetical protein